MKKNDQQEMIEKTMELFERQLDAFLEYRKNAKTTLLNVIQNRSIPLYIVKTIMDTIDDHAWNVLVERLEMYHGENFTNDQITWPLIEEANIGYIETEDLAFYAITPTSGKEYVGVIRNNQKPAK